MNFEKVIIMTDLDGTLLDDKKQISPKDMAAIDDFRSKGGLFTLATGRGVAMARSIVEKLKVDIPCVIFNGAAVYDFTADKFLWHSSRPDCAADYIKTLAKEFPDIGIEILHAEKVYVTNYNHIVDDVFQTVEDFVVVCLHQLFTFDNALGLHIVSEAVGLHGLSLVIVVELIEDSERIGRI